MVIAPASILMLSIVPAVAASPMADPTPAAIGRDVAREGPKAVVDRLYRSGAWWRVVVKRVASAAPGWIALAPRLAPGTDAATSESLGESLVKALPLAPAPVLAVLDISGDSVPLSPATVCSAGFYEGDPTDPVRYRARAVRAVSAIQAPELAEARRACLMHLTRKDG